MLERVWRKGKPLTLLVGVQIGTATMENSVEIPQKLEIELPYDPAIPLLGTHPEETRTEGDMCTPVFIAAVFTIAGTWKQSRFTILQNIFWLLILSVASQVKHKSAFWSSRCSPDWLA